MKTNTVKKSIARTLVLIQGIITALICLVVLYGSITGKL